MAECNILIGGLNEVAELYPLWDKGVPMKVWAENGLVHWVDNRNGGYGCMHWRDAADRVLALSDMIHKSHEKGYYTAETRALQQFICDMEAVLRKAKEQNQKFKNTTSMKQPVVHKIKPILRDDFLF